MAGAVIEAEDMPMNVLPGRVLPGHHQGGTMCFGALPLTHRCTFQDTGPPSAYPGRYPRPWLLGRSLLMTGLAADHLLAATSCPTRAGLRLLRSCWALVGHRRAVLSAESTSECIPREGGARGPGTVSFWTQPLNPLWLVGSDDGSVARSCTYP